MGNEEKLRKEIGTNKIVRITWKDKLRGIDGEEEIFVSKWQPDSVGRALLINYRTIESKSEIFRIIPFDSVVQFQIETLPMADERDS